MSAPDAYLPGESDTEPPYARWLPGPWVDLTVYDGDAEPEEYRARCQVCARELTIGFESEDEYPRLAAEARRDWEGHVADLRSSEVRYFDLPGVGRHKYLHVGQWVDVVRAIPYLLFAGDPVPPIAVLNHILAGADGDAGMSGGVEWPRHQLTDSEYEEIRRDLVGELALIDTVAPDWVRSAEDFRVWTLMMKFGCTRAAAIAWGRAVMESGGGEALDVLHEEQDEWLRAFDESEPGTT